MFLLPIKLYSGVETVVEGKVLEKSTGKGIPFANVTLRNAASFIGTITDTHGYFHLKTDDSLDTLIVSFVGYETVVKTIELGKKNNLTIKLEETSTTLGQVNIKGKKDRYSKKNNPAVELIEQAIAQKSQNRIENLAYYQYKQYDKVKVALSNLSDSTEQKKMMRKYNFLADYIDTSELSGKRILPFCQTETVSETYYRKNPKSTKTFIDGYKAVEITKFLSSESMDMILRDVFGEINIYENNIFFLQNQFMSPLSPLSPGFYKFFIEDTVKIEGVDCIKMLFSPRNPADFGFVGYLYLTADNQQYAVRRTELQFTKNTPVNYVKDILIKQDYELIQGIWTMTHSVTMADFALAGENIFPFYGQKEIIYDNFIFNTPQKNEFYQGSALIVRKDGYDERDEEYWKTNIAKTTDSTKNTYAFMDKLEKVRVYRVIRDFVTSFVSGYYAVGFFDFGPWGNMISWNTIEGPRLRIGGKTNGKMSRHFFIETFAAYGLKDDKFKYNLTGHYSFNKKKNHPWEFPVNLLSVSYENNTDIPGQEYLYGTFDRIYTSIGRGTTDRMTLNKLFKINYEKETINNFSFDVNFTHLQEYALGQLSFTTNSGYDFAPYTTSSFGMKLRYAPNEKYIQVEKYRYPINVVAPVFDVSYQIGINDFLGGDYTFHKITARFQKRWFISSYGYLDTYIDAGKIFNQVPYPTLFVHHANQSWAYQDEAYNTMRYFEFVSDQYVDVQASYCFNGLLFSRIPLIKKLNWRGIITFKALFGNVSGKNMPDAETNPDLMIFPHDLDGNPITFTLNKEPFLEGNIGIDNIFKVLRIDLVKRFNYLDHSNINEWILRARLRFVF